MLRTSGISASNQKVLENGFKKIEQMKERIFVREFLPKYARQLVLLYLDYYKQEHNPALTGNTFTGMVVGMYVNGTLKNAIGTVDLGAVAATSEQPMPGDGGFIDYSGYLFPDANGLRIVKKVQNYARESGLSFQQTEGGYGVQNALEFLRSYNPKAKKGYSVVACVGTDYSAWLEKVRHLNILSGTAQEAPGIALVMMDEISMAYSK